MGARNILRLLTESLIAGEGIDLPSGNSMQFIPEVNDQGSLVVGNGTQDMDFKVFLGASTQFMEANVGQAQLNINSANVHLNDNDLIEFGGASTTAGDFTVGFDGTQLEVLPTTDDTGAVNFGDGTTDADVKVFLGSTSENVLFDVGNSKVDVNGVPVGLTGAGRYQTKINAITSNTTLNTTHFGGTVTTRGAAGTLVLTLPAAASNSGEWVEIYNVADQALHVKGQDEELVVFNDATADEIRYNTAGEQIGGGFKAVCDGTSWIVVPLATETQTITVVSA